ncbi:MAG: Fic family protein [Gammaproteobacteria bacterium]|nr:Fic family protein [Gammaproteobacteria bacterium]
MIDRVNDAQLRFSGVPILPDVATKLEREVIVSSVFGTNTIEGGTLTEEETAGLLGDVKNININEEKERRVTNIRNAYNLADDVSKKAIKNSKGGGAIHLEEFMLLDLHRIITEGLSHQQNIPGSYRDNIKGQLTKVGDEDHGGIYTPPKNYRDIKTLVSAFLSWINSESIIALDPLIRAPLAHYYFERIHPFADGNGRVGRVLEAILLKCSGFKYAPFAMSRYYLSRIDEYFTVFNIARKKSEKKQPFPNTVFVEFFLNGMLSVINHLHDRVNVMVSFLLYEVKLNTLLQTKKINVRQYTIINNLLPKGTIHGVSNMQAQQWYTGLYKNLTPRTRYRDLERLSDFELLKIDKNKNIILLIPGNSK